MCYIVCSLVGRLKIFSSSSIYLKDYSLVFENIVLHEKRFPKNLAFDFSRISADKVAISLNISGIYIYVDKLKIRLQLQKKDLFSETSSDIEEEQELSKEGKTLVKIIDNFIYNSQVQLRNIEVECLGSILSVVEIGVKNKVISILEIRLLDKFQVLAIPSTVIVFEKNTFVFTGNSTINLKLDKSITDKLSNASEILSFNKLNRKALLNLISLTESLESSTVYSLPSRIKEDEEDIPVKILFKGYHIRLDWYKDFSKFGLESNHLSFFFENVTMLADHQGTLLGINKLSTTVGNTSRIDIRLSSKRELVISVNQITSETSKNTINNISKLFKSTEQDFEVIHPSFYFSKVVFSCVNIKVMYINEKANVQKLFKGHFSELLKFIPPHDLEFNFPRVQLGNTNDIEGVFFGWLKVLWATKKGYILGKLGKMVSKGKRTFT